MTGTEETEPLISTTVVNCYGSKPQSVSYHAIPLEENTTIYDNERSTGRTAAAVQKDARSKTKRFTGWQTPESITYTWSDVNVYAAKTTNKWIDQIFLNRNKKPVQQRHLLKDVCGVAYPGELLVIMGSSGAGKTTLLNALTFRSGRGVTVSGIMAANGQRVSSKLLTSRTAYVQQDDLFVGTLTVKEHLLFQAMVRMDRRIPFGQRLERVNKVINELALTKCRNTIIGQPGRTKGLSGGEMKRLSFASEVLTDPPLMFCDEPTSGLDSFMAHQVVTVLRTLAGR